MADQAARESSSPGASLCKSCHVPCKPATDCRAQLTRQLPAGRRPRCLTGTRWRPPQPSADGTPHPGPQAWELMPLLAVGGTQPQVPPQGAQPLGPQLPVPPREAAGGMQPPLVPPPARIAGTRPLPLAGYALPQRPLAPQCLLLHPVAHAYVSTGAWSGAAHAVACAVC